ncbi:hypothetical protein Tco_0201409 [Tanacetum coccineum]
MHTRSQSRNLHHQQHQAPPPVVEPFNLEEPIENPDPYSDGYYPNYAQYFKHHRGLRGCHLCPEIIADYFGAYARSWLNIVQNKLFFRHLDIRRSSCPHPIFQQDHFYDEVPERPEYVGKAYAFPIFPRGGSPDLA